MADREWTVQVDIYNPHLFAGGIDGVSHIFTDIGNGTDGDNDTVRVRRAVVVEEVICPPRNGADLIHIALHDIGKRVIKRVGRLAVLEVDIGIFRCAADDGPVRIQRTGAECGESFLVDERFQFVVLHDFHFLYFMACAESVEEIDERHAAFNGRQVGNAGKIHDFLYIRFSKHGTAGGSRTHYVLMVSENRKGVVCKGAGGDMEDAGKKFTGYFIHIRQHEKHSL